MGLLHRINSNFADIRSFGLGYPLRHLSRRLGKQHHPIDLPGVGRIWLRHGTTDAEVCRQVFQSREYDLSKLGRYQAIKRRYDTLVEAGQVPVIIDAGANIGIASLWFAKEFPAARIIAVEPEPRNAARCRANVSFYPTIVVREAAIGSRSGHIFLSNPAGKAWSPRSERSEDGGIDVVTISELLGTVPNGKLFIAKIDIEGFESDLFAADLAWIDLATVVILEIHDWMLPGAGTSFNLQQAMGGRKFEILISGENLVYFNVSHAAATAKAH